MTDIEKLTAWFEAQIGTAETGANNVIYNTHYYGGPVNGDSFPWCCAFIWDGFRQCGLSALFCGGEKSAYCPYVYNYARTHGQLVSGDYRAGDLLLYDWDGDGTADHIGFCTGASGSMVTVIEGNVGDKVARLTRTAGSVKAAFRPRYGNTGSAGKTPETDGGTSGRPSPTYTVKAGDSLWAIAERELGDGTLWSEIQRLNGMSGIAIYPGQILKLPGTRGVEDAAPYGDTGGESEKVTIEVSAEVERALRAAAEAEGVSIEDLLREEFLK